MAAEEFAFAKRRAREAAEFLREAANADHAAATEADYASAVAMYGRGLSALRDSIKHEKKEEIKRALAAQAKMFMARVKTIEAELARHAAAPTSSTRSHVVADASDGASASANAGAANEVDAFLSTLTVETPTASWEDIQGLEEAKETLRNAVELPRDYPQFFDNGIPPLKGVLLFGPPGTGKTSLVRAAAAAHGGKFISVTGSSIMNKYQGQSELNVKLLCLGAEKLAPCVLFIDEIDALLGSQKHQTENQSSTLVKREFQVRMDHFATLSTEKRVLVVGATNYPGNIEVAILRRFDATIYIPLPNEEARGRILRYYLRKVDHSLTTDDIDDLARRTQRMSGANLESLCKRALEGPMNHVRVATRWRVEPETCALSEATRAVAVVSCVDGASECEGTPCARCGSRAATLSDFPKNVVGLRRVGMVDFELALAHTKPTSSQRDIEAYEAWQSSHSKASRPS